MMKKLIHFIFNKKNEKTVLIALPLLSILIASCVLVPQIISIIKIIRENPEPLNNDIICTEELENISITPTDTINVNYNTADDIIISLHEDIIKIHLSATSVDKDLYVFVKDENNSPILGTEFNINLKYPDGHTTTYNTNLDGSCYIISTPPGQYTISMNPIDGFTTADMITCTVTDSVNYKQIENIEDIIEIKDLSLGLDEIKNNQPSESLHETVIDYIDSSEENNESNIENTAIVYDSNGNITYNYSYETDEEGFLKYRNGESSDIIPNEENSVLVCGFRYNSKNNVYETVDLFNDDNLPINDYWIDAVPNVQVQSVLNGWQNENGQIVYYNNGVKLSGLKNIDGKLYYFDTNGFQADSVGIDVSFYNGNINWAAVKNAGIDFVIIRLGFRGWGSAAIYQDTCFEQNLRNAKAAGLKVGVYFYSTAVNKVEAIEEASISLEWIKNRELDLPIYIDLEFSGDYPNGRQDKLSPASRTEVALAFCETIKNSGYNAGIYATQSYFKDELNYNSLAQYSIWMASFTDNFSLPNTGFNYDIWQFTDYGKVAGINGSTDFNVIF